jgi:lipopolysaccharide/colanic/teichoic acid biosynthesis glycosyltransferase
VLKRAFDITLASAGLLVLWPVMLLVAVLIKSSSPGPAFYRHRRIGRYGREISVIKFRTMVKAKSESGWQITVGGDPRITAIGRRLRRTHFDEVPQLWNVLRGDMSLVGWRPHVAGYPDRLTGPDAALIEERPGMTGAASLYFRNEEHMLSQVDDPRQHYDEVIYPMKVRMDLEYFRSWSLSRDLACLITSGLPAADRWFHVVPKTGHPTPLARPAVDLPNAGSAARSLVEPEEQVDKAA